MLEHTPESPVVSFGSPPDDSVEVDPNEDLKDELTSSTALDELVTELQDEVELEPLPLPVPGRPGWEAVFKRDVDSVLIQKWARQCSARDLGGGVNQYAMALRVLATANLGLRRSDKDVTVDGAPLTFRHKRFLALYDTDQPFTAIGDFYGRDGDVVTAAEEVLRAAGYTGDLSEAASEGPTRRRSRAGR